MRYAPDFLVAIPASCPIVDRMARQEFGLLEMRKTPVLPGSWGHRKGYAVQVRYKEGGKVIRRWFASAAECDQWCAAYLAERMSGGEDGAITEHERAVLMEYRKPLRDAGLDLRTVVEAGLHALDQAARGMRVSVLVEARLAGLRESSGPHTVHYQVTKSRLEAFRNAFGTQAVTSLTPSVLQAFLGRFSDLSPATRRNWHAVLHSLFAEAVVRGVISRNPMDRVRKPKVPPPKIGILTVEEAAEVLRVAKKQGCLGPTAVGLFAGLRASEVDRLQPGDILLHRRLLRVEGKKTGMSRRFVEMEPPLVAILDGLTEEWDPSHYQRQLLTRSLPFRWPSNALRHSYASYWLAKHRDVIKLASLMGNSAAVIHRHYAELVDPADAERFWEIPPP